ncbi:hypothetical protein HDU97_003699 [Phlyctochytrium planicorne]|nr:hypothetical protein HDU97_003699 [Phlyctochytrium planicorne]
MASPSPAPSNCSRSSSSHKMSIDFLTSDDDTCSNPLNLLSKAIDNQERRFSNTSCSRKRGRSPISPSHGHGHCYGAQQQQPPLSPSPTPSPVSGQFPSPPPSPASMQNVSQENECLHAAKRQRTFSVIVTPPASAPSSAPSSWAIPATATFIPSSSQPQPQSLSQSLPQKSISSIHLPAAAGGYIQKGNPSQGFICPLAHCNASFLRRYNMVQHFKAHANRIGISAAAVEKGCKALKGVPEGCVPEFFAMGGAGRA